jgi:7-cyano-7-deazaguanine synthase
MPSAVVLLSGGLDSATVLAMARAEGYTCHTLTIEYGQRHTVEVAAAAELSQMLGAASHRVFHIPLADFGGSALTDDIAVPKDRDHAERVHDIPVTYVPARNTVFLSIALAYAEVLECRHLFIGANAVDYSGYPDCRREFLDSFEATANLGTKAGVDGDRFTVHAPLLMLTKAEIIRTGQELGVDYGRTHSCYDPSPSGAACGACDSCRIRQEAFRSLGQSDPVQR